MSNDFLPKEKREELVKKLKSKGIHLICPMCGNTEFALIDGYSSINLQKDYHGVSITGKAIPVTGIVCRKCGFVSLHALGTLGLLEKDIKKTDLDEKKEKDNKNK